MRLSKEKFLDALTETGMFSVARREAQVTESQLVRWMNDDEFRHSISQIIYQDSNDWYDRF